GTGHSTKQLYSALFFINCVHFIDYSPFLYSNSPHSPSFPIPSHVFFSSKSNHARSPKNTSSPKSKTRKSPCPFPMQHALRRTIIFFPLQKNKRSPRFIKNALFSKFPLIPFSR
ncbi:hypothetical protein, partial [Anaerotignum lactatifermentans]|uniref:hypothetical protein n=1 Tax=Anaerotignum lactatifermentans TaxID=160404 RepID=UPI003080D4EB